MLVLLFKKFNQRFDLKRHFRLFENPVKILLLLKNIKNLRFVYNFVVLYNIMGNFWR